MARLSKITLRRCFCRLTRNGMCGFFWTATTLIRWQPGSHPLLQAQSRSGHVMKTLCFRCVAVAKPMPRLKKRAHLVASRGTGEGGVHNIASFSSAKFRPKGLDLPRSTMQARFSTSSVDAQTFRSTLQRDETHAAAAAAAAISAKPTTPPKGLLIGFRGR